MKIKITSDELIHDGTVSIAKVSDCNGEIRYVVGNVTAKVATGQLSITGKPFIDLTEATEHAYKLESNIANAVRGMK